MGKIIYYKICIEKNCHGKKKYEISNSKQVKKNARSNNINWRL